MKKISLLLLAGVFLMISTVGCSTAKGVGKDIEKAGKSIQDTADKNK